MTSPLVSFVIIGRNDGYMGDYRYRLGTSLSFLAQSAARAGLLDEAALGRIKDAIFGEISLRRPASVPKEEYNRTMRRRLDALFAGSEPLGQKPPVPIGPVIGAE